MHTAEAALVSVIGPEGAGKTTLCRSLATRVGGVALSVPEWPSLQDFLRSPSEHAYSNQTEAMTHTLRAHQDQRHAHPSAAILADSCPDRIHLIHSWQLHNDGFLSGEQWLSLERQYQDALKQWGQDYVYLQAPHHVLRARLHERGRTEDEEHNARNLARVARRWEEVVADPGWRQGKNILELDSQVPVQGLCDSAEDWLLHLTNKRVEVT